mmetsp:Transcript_34728/g.71652  ORF Transcript_34728/g.71652 Transcript_34728/m.71652 type:complete len:151 (+) Transcript_34728:68-520(+)
MDAATEARSPPPSEGDLPPSEGTSYPNVPQDEQSDAREHPVGPDAATQPAHPQKQANLGDGTESSKRSLGLELTVNESKRLVVSRLHAGGVAQLSGQVKIGDTLSAFRILYAPGDEQKKFERATKNSTSGSSTRASRKWRTSGSGACAPT